MRIWFALLVAPLLALADQSVSLAAVDWACANQSPLAVHAVHVLFLAVVAGSAVPALHVWRATAQRAKGASESLAQRHFLAGLATASAALSAIAIVAMWLTAWVIAPCYR